MSSAPPPGWYPDPWGQAPRRLWDGVRWTQRLSTDGPMARPRLPDGAPLHGPDIWLVTLLPLLSAVMVWFLRIDASAIADYVTRVQELAQSGSDAPPPFLDAFSVFGSGYPVFMLVSLALTATLVVLAYRDRQHLARLGVVRPFHWAWAFLGWIVYVVGRSVVVHKVAGSRGLTPVWVAAVVLGIDLASSGVWLAVAIGSVAQQVSPALG